MHMPKYLQSQTRDHCPTIRKLPAVKHYTSPFIPVYSKCHLASTDFMFFSPLDWCHPPPRKHPYNALCSEHQSIFQLLQCEMVNWLLLMLLHLYACILRSSIQELRSSFQLEVWESCKRVKIADKWKLAARIQIWIEGILKTWKRLIIEKNIEFTLTKRQYDSETGFHSMVRIPSFLSLTHSFCHPFLSPPPFFSLPPSRLLQGGPVVIARSLNRLLQRTFEVRPRSLWN